MRQTGRPRAAPTVWWNCGRPFADPPTPYDHRGQGLYFTRHALLLSSNGARTMTIKTLAAVVGTLAIIVVLFFITKITTPSRLVAKSGFFAGSSTDDWGRGTGATGFWEPIRVEGRQEQMPQ